MIRHLEKSRAGALLLELVISGLILGIIMSTALPLLGWIARERQLNRQREAAILEVGNLMERVTALDWDELTADRIGAIPLSPELLRQAPDAKLVVSIDAEPADAKMKRVLLELRWESGPGKAAPPVRLAAWVGRRWADREEHLGGGRVESRVGL